MPGFEPPDIPTVEWDSDATGERLSDLLGLADDLASTTLGLPSDLTEEERILACSNSELLVEIEASLRRAEAHEALDLVRNAARSLDMLGKERLVHTRGQGPNTRSRREVDARIDRKRIGISMYTRARDCLLSLGALTNDSMLSYYPPLTLDDTKRRNPAARREVGDSRAYDGRAWHPLQPPPLPTLRPGSATRADLQPSTSGTRRNTGSEILSLF